MRCQFCDHDVPNLVRVSSYGKGIWVCGNCFEMIQAHSHKPYSKVMDKVALLEAGYHVNRKLARTNK